MIISQYALVCAKIVAVSAALAFAVACQPTAGPSDVSEPPTSSPVTDQVSDIKGDWRLVRIDGLASETKLPNDETPAEVRLIVGDLTMQANSQCISFAWRYQIESDQIRLVPENPSSMCARGLTVWERDFERVINGVSQARIIAGGLRLNGPAGELEFASNPSVATIDLTGE